MLFLKFEDLKQDLPGQVSRIADYMGVQLSDEQLKRVVEMSSLEYMQSRGDKIQGKDWVSKVTGLEVADDYKLVDTGVTGKKELSAKMREAMRVFFRDKAGPILGGISAYSDLIASSPPHKEL